MWRDPEMLPKYLPIGSYLKKNDTDLVYYFHNGAVLGIKGSDSPDSLRGPNPLGVVLDEYALIKPEVWEEILAPIMFANPSSWIWFIGTPKPVGAHFNKLHKEACGGKEGWFGLTLSVHETNLLSEEILKEARDNMTEASYEQEYLCKQYEKDGVVFRGIDKCIEGVYDHQKIIFGANEKVVFGIDLAKYVDWTVIIGISRRTNKIIYFDRFNQIDYNLQKAKIEAVLRRFNNARAYIDATGVGDPIVEDLMSRGLNVEGVVITENEKKNLISNLSLFIEQRKIKIPLINELLNELRIFGYEVSHDTHRMKYGAPSGFHDDCVLALAFAVKGLDRGILLAKYNVLDSMLNISNNISKKQTKFSYE